MLRIHCLALIFPALGALAATAPSIVARVNGEPVMSQGDTPVNRLVLMTLVSQDARKKKLEADPAVKAELDRVLYEAQLERLRAQSGESLEPTEASLGARYDRFPMIRVRHLALLVRTPEERARAKEALATISKELGRGKDFKELVLRFSQDDSVRVGGDLDFRGAHSLPPELYAPALKLRKGEVTKPIESGEGIHLIQLMDQKPLSQAPATYLQWLRAGLKAENEEAFLARLLERLKKGAQVEIVSREGHS